jgi:hypothetical protein
MQIVTALLERLYNFKLLFGCHQMESIRSIQSNLSALISITCRSGSMMYSCG